MIREFTFDNKGRYKYLYSILLKLSLTCLALIFAYSYFNDLSLQDILLPSLAVTGFILVMNVLPLLILFFNHRKNSVGIKLVFDGINSQYQLHEKRGITTIPTIDVTSVNKVVSPPSYDNRIDWLLFGSYHYWHVKTKDQNIKISCLICDDENIFQKSKISLSKKAIPLM